MSRTRLSEWRQDGEARYRIPVGLRIVTEAPGDPGVPYEPRLVTVAPFGYGGPSPGYTWGGGGYSWAVDCGTHMQFSVAPVDTVEEAMAQADAAAGKEYDLQ